MSDIDTVMVDSLKALDPEWPIREADIARAFMSTRPIKVVKKKPGAQARVREF